MKRFVTALVVLTMAGPAMGDPSADFAAIDNTLKTCLARDGSTPAVDNCNARAHSAADRILNRLYGAQIAQLNHPSKGDPAADAEILKRLVASERAWITYRDKNCDFDSTSMLGGTGESNVYSRCLYDMTKQRALYLAGAGKARGPQ
jgi:uncharacterized protein YecT (DUF1311 family)